MLENFVLVNGLHKNMVENHWQKVVAVELLSQLKFLEHCTPLFLCQTDLFSVDPGT